MSEMKDFDESAVFMNLVIDQNWAVQQFADVRPFSHETTHAGITSQQFHMIEQGVAKTAGSLIVVFGDIANDLSEIS